MNQAHRRAWFEYARSILIEMVSSVFKIQIVRVHSHMSTVTGEKIIILTADKNVETE